MHGGDVIKDEYEVPNGMARSVFENKYSRRKPDGTFQTYKERVLEVVDGNFLLDPRGRQAGGEGWESYLSELSRTEELAVSGVFPTSGRHLQHGDADQPDRLLELHANCATAMFSFMLFRLLLRGSGVGRDYSAAVCRVDFSKMPDVRLVLDEAHPDFDQDRFQGFLEPLRDARHKYDSESEYVRWFDVDDSREGWTKVVEILETAAWQEKHANKLFIFNFTPVRAAGVPIKGLQGRPASGPLPLMDAIAKLASIKTAGMKPWKQALFIDHYLAACVHMGGARRSARMAVKSWRDRDVIEFIDIKRGGFLWSANNSLLVDADFWKDAREPRHSHARRVFEAASNAAYFDRTGEPGFINVDRLNLNRTGMEVVTGENYINPAVYKDLHRRTRDMVDNVLEHVKKLKYPFLVNPCFAAETLITTDQGAFPIEELVGKSVTIHDGKEWRSVDNFRVTGHDQPMVRINLYDGSYLRVTPAHTLVLQDGTRTRADSLEIGDRLLQNDVEYDGDINEPGAYIKGFMIGDGSIRDGKLPLLWLYEPKYVCENRLISSALEVPRNSVRSDAIMTFDFVDVSTERQPRKRMRGLSPLTDELKPWCGEYRHGLPSRVFRWTRQSKLEFLAGLFDADAGAADSSEKGFGYQLCSIYPPLLRDIQTLLKSIGVRSRICTANPGGERAMPGGIAHTQPCWRITIGHTGCVDLSKQVKFTRLRSFEDKLAPYNMRSKASTVISVEDDGIDDEVYCCTVSGTHAVSLAIGVTTGQCGEIVLSTYGGYCVIGDVCLARVARLEDACDAAGLMAKFLIRCNLMRCDYAAEVQRTNRIGVSLTGIHEFAWNLFGLTFHQMIDYYDHPSVSHVAHKFWWFIEGMRKRVEIDGSIYSTELGLAIPHTFTTIKPSGTISKVMVCTEGAHLPPLTYYLRWVQYKKDDPAVEDLIKRGYPMEDIGHRYHQQVIIGFPTKQPIVDLMGEAVVTADETTPEENFKWLCLLERFWLGGPNENNQVSYTLKYDTNKVTYPDFMEIILRWQPEVRCCSVMPQSDWRESKKIYGYVPEQPISRDEYDEMIAKITHPVEREEYDDDELACEGGVCPIEPDQNR